MPKHFLKNIHIVDFKCFQNFKADNFKRVNLISGKNNVGKTAFMEACFTNVYAKDIETFYNALRGVTFMRNCLEYMGETFNRTLQEQLLENITSFDVMLNINKTQFKFITEQGIQHYIFSLNSQTFKINKNVFSFQLKSNSNIQFINNFGLSNDELKEVYEAVQTHEKENLLAQYIHSFDNSIENFKIIGGDKPQCKTNGIYRDINEFGDGLKHYISIICALYACSDGYLFIDEIDNGIHYTLLEKLWEIIFTISKEVNCQLFATTHSKEMIDAYAKVSKKLQDEDMSFIELGLNKYNDINAITMDFDRFHREIKNDNEIRGW